MIALVTKSVNNANYAFHFNLCHTFRRKCLGTIKRDISACLVACHCMLAVAVECVHVSSRHNMLFVIPPKWNLYGNLNVFLCRLLSVHYSLDWGSLLPHSESTNDDDTVGVSKYHWKVVGKTERRQALSLPRGDTGKILRRNKNVNRSFGSVFTRCGV